MGRQYLHFLKFVSRNGFQEYFELALVKKELQLELIEIKLSLTKLKKTKIQPGSSMQDFEQSRNRLKVLENKTGIIEDKLKLVDHKSISGSSPSLLLISLLIPSSQSEDIILNMEDLYDVWVGRYGTKKARRIFKIQMFGVIIHHWIKPIKKLLIAAAGYFGLTSFLGLFK